MAGLLPQMSLEPAPGYRRFVERHFEALRRDAGRLAGGGNGPDVDELCSGVLSDIALRWRWFELLRVRLRRADPAGAYLGVALARRVARWRPEEPDDEEPREIHVEAVGNPTAFTWPTRRPEATSAAVRIAAVRPLPAYTPSPQVEAVIAWLHAHAAYERFRRFVFAAAVVVAVAALVKLRGG